ncbi:chromatin remodeling complex Adenosinetriphosphatase [Glugoides intestinalis]
MSRKTLHKYAKFIGDNEFLREFIPNIEMKGADSDPVESYIFTTSPKYVKVTLRDYQIEGLNWLINMHENGINCILADEMGLGKTLQTISFLGYLNFVKDEKNKHLIVVPKSCLQNWYDEFNRFIPEMRIKIFHTSKAEIKKESKALFDKKYDAVLTTYEMCLYAKLYFKEVNWSYIIIDEAHRLKNENSQLSKILRLFKFKHRLLLTGTPLQNNIHELWALLNFIVPDFFKDAEKFENYVLNADKEEKSIEKLRNVLQLFFLRREKIDVEKSLMGKKHINIYCPLSYMQRDWYKSILKKDLSGVYFDKGVKMTLLNIVMQLKKCCNHPYLFEGAEPEPFETGEHLIINSGKMVILDKLLHSLKSKGSRVLIFSQMAQMLDILEDYVVYRGFSYCRIDGKTSSENRTTAIDTYNSPDSDKFIFLLTTRAGGLGINLYTADTVVIFDSDWNPQADLQAQDRAHRIGQKKQVHVFRFITENSIEEGIYMRAQQKLKLDDILIQKGQKIQHSITENELLDILSHGIDITQKVSTDMSLEEILRKGEDKNKEMENKIQNFKIADTVESKIDLYQWEGENYSRKKIEEFIAENTEETRTKRTELFSTVKFKKLIFPEYQFYPKEFYELQDKEEELFNKNKKLSEEEQKKKEELLKLGFDWTKKDFKAFLSLVELYFNDFDKIKEALPYKTDVEQYYTTFMARYEELSDVYKIPSILERARQKNDKKCKLKHMFSLENRDFEKYLTCKNKVYNDNLGLLMLYQKYMDDPMCFEKIRKEILSDSDAMFDYFILTRSTSELSKHINGMLTQLLKALGY